jgi:hypothetical protein
MAKEHQRVVSTLIDASKSTGRGYDCLFNKAMNEMVTFLEIFATRAAPFSGAATREAPFSGAIDNQFELLMDNFGTVIDTLSIFYDRFDCEGRSETLKLERDEKRMALFCFEKNERRPPMDLWDPESWRVLEEVYGPAYIESIFWMVHYRNDY